MKDIKYFHAWNTDDFILMIHRIDHDLNTLKRNAYKNSTSFCQL